MSRSFVLTVAITFVGAGAAGMAQSHPQKHDQTRPHHRPDHPPMDPAQHAALHAALHGTWTGTSVAPEGTSAKLHLAVAKDKAGNVGFTISADKSLRLGPARTVAVEGTVVRWTQDVAGAPCQANAILNPATKTIPETMKGRLSCANGEEIAFTLEKTKG